MSDIRLLLLAAALSLIVAAVPTWQDWRLNPSGLFHGPEGNHWPVVAETLLSWAWPVFATLAALIVLRRAWIVMKARNP